MLENFIKIGDIMIDTKSIIRIDLVAENEITLTLKSLDSASDIPVYSEICAFSGAEASALRWWIELQNVFDVVLEYSREQARKAHQSKVWAIQDKVSKGGEMTQEERDFLEQD